MVSLPRPESMAKWRTRLAAMVLMFGWMAASLPCCAQKIVAQMQGGILVAQVNQNFLSLIGEVSVTQGSNGKATVCIMAYNDSSLDARFVHCGDKIGGEYLRLTMVANTLAEFSNPEVQFNSTYENGTPTNQLTLATKISTNLSGQTQSFSSEDGGVTSQGQVIIHRIEFSGETLASVELDFRMRFIKDSQEIGNVTGYVIGDF